MDTSKYTLERCSILAIPAIMKMVKELYLELGEEAESINYLNPELLKRILEEGKTTIYIINDIHQNIIGMLSLTQTQAIFAGGSYGVIDDMYIKPNFRSSRLGELLLNKAKEVAREKEWKRLDVTTPTDNPSKTLNFYEKNGFVYTGNKMKFKIE